MVMRLVAAILGILGAIVAFGQSSNLPLNRDYYHLLDRMIIKKKDLPPAFSGGIKGYPRELVTEILDSLDISKSKSDEFNLNYLKNDSWEYFDDQDNSSKKPFMKHFYKVQSDFYHVDTEDFNLHVNPVLYFSSGFVSNDDRTPFINTRGVEIRGMIDKKVGFYSFLGENQARFPVYIRDYIATNRVIPQEGFWKNFKTAATDFFTPKGYISFNATSHINFQFGHDQFFIGNGYRSFMLSDFAPPFLFLKINTRVWRLNYMNLFTQMKADAFGASGSLLANSRFPEKYVSMHRLGINITDNFNLGLFEAVVYGAEDSLRGSNFQIAYLNPIIFYRAIEQQNGSADNAIIGMDFLWNLARKYSLYGQLIFDELKVDELTGGDGWWGNKYAIQLGAKYIDVLNISNLDAQLEFNTARPFTFSHRTIYTNYAHYRQPLGHPLGANFREWLGVIRYQPVPRLFMTGKMIYANYGQDSSGFNFGKNILLDDDTRIADFGNETVQGVDTKLMFMDLTASYMLKHNLFLDGTLIYRNEDSDQPNASRDNVYIALSLRLNIRKRLQEF